MADDEDGGGDAKYADSPVTNASSPLKLPAWRRSQWFAHTCQALRVLVWALWLWVLYHSRGWALLLFAAFHWVDQELDMANVPHPFHWPILGILGPVLMHEPRVLEWDLDMAQTVGHPSHVRCILNGERAWLLFDRDDVEYILKTNQPNFLQGRRRKMIFSDLLGDGIFNADGKLWRMQRKIASHEFTVQKFKTFTFDVFTEHAAILCDVLRQHAQQGDTFDIQDVFSRFSFDTICKIAYGIEVGTLQNKEVDFMCNFDVATQMILKRFPNPLWKLFRILNIGDERKLRVAVAVVKQFAKKVIEERRLLSETALEQHSDLLSRFFLARDSHGKSLTDDMLQDIVLNFVLAGRDTTSNCMTWTWYELAQHPGVVARLRQEIKDTVGDQALSFDAIKRMPYLQAVVCEALRLHPSVPVDFKECSERDTLPSGYVVQPKEQVVFFPWLMGRFTWLWGEDAETFRPERWLGKQGECRRVDPFLYPVFQPGPRQCLGINLAQMEVQVLTAEVVRHFDLTLAPNQEVTYQRSLTLPVRNGLLMSCSEWKG